MIRTDLTQGNLFQKMITFAIPYLIACFLQTFYGLADLFITGLFNNAIPVTAVSIGSQVMHMLTVVIVALVMGSTISIGHAIGGKREAEAGKAIGNSITLFTLFAMVFTGILLCAIDQVLSLLKTPPEAYDAAKDYLFICFAGLPFIVAYNVLSGIFRGLGDTKSPMYFVAIAGVVNIALDYLLIGPFAMGAAGAAWGTVISQAISVVLALLYLCRKDLGIPFSRKYLTPDWYIMGRLLSIGFPIACQDGVIQISFLIITAIANSRGVEVAAAVGIVEKVIGFLFLVPSSMLSTVSTLTAQNAGAGLHDRGKKALRYGMAICTGYSLLCIGVIQFAAEWVVSCFVSEIEVIRLGGEYFRAYVWDVLFAGFQFCYSGYFSAYGKSIYAFIHNFLSTILVRVPGTYLAVVLFPTTLYPMGLASPAGSLFSTFICLGIYWWRFRALRFEG